MHRGTVIEELITSVERTMRANKREERILSRAEQRRIVELSNIPALMLYSPVPSRSTEVA